MSDNLDTMPENRDETDAPAATDGAVGASGGQRTLERAKTDRHGELVRDIELADAAGAEEVSGPTTLWSDGWRVLRRRPLFWISLVVILAMVVMAVFPQAYLWFYEPFPDQPTLDKTFCALSNSVSRQCSPYQYRNSPAR